MFIKLLTSTVLIKLLDPEPDLTAPNPNEEQKFQIWNRQKKLGSSQIRIRIWVRFQIRIRNTTERDNIVIVCFTHQWQIMMKINK